MSRQFGAVRQLGYVVKDIEAAMRHWIDLGVGPWFYKEDVGSTEYRYMGKAAKPPKVSIALANSGPLQLELVQQRDHEPSLYLDSLARNGEGAQHVAYWTMDKYDEYCRAFEALGYIEGHGGRMGVTRGRYCYYIRPDLPSVMIELSELSGGKAEYFEAVKLAAQTWDGSEAIRRIAVAK